MIVDGKIKPEEEEADEHLRCGRKISLSLHVKTIATIEFIAAASFAVFCLWAAHDRSPDQAKLFLGISNSSSIVRSNLGSINAGFAVIYFSWLPTILLLFLGMKKGISGLFLPRVLMGGLTVMYYILLFVCGITAVVFHGFKIPLFICIFAICFAGLITFLSTRDVWQYYKRFRRGGGGSVAGSESGGHPAKMPGPVF